MRAGVPEDVRELVRLVGRVDCHQRQAGQPGGEFEQHPFGAVARPDRDRLAGREPGAQRPGGPFGLGQQLAVAPLPVSGDQRDLARRPPGGLAQHAADGGLADRREGVGGPIRSSQRQGWHDGISP